ncbi:hypothetical protein, partial [Sulfitobacter sp. HI0027]|uniref:hypothetical protein n=1 Tax=Sulfitobacter sp. HI0027 TaxID=1822226 RepID=UPI001F414DC7
MTGQAAIDVDGPSSSEIDVAAPGSIAGTWEGEAICRAGDTFFGLQVEDVQSPRITGLLQVAGPDALVRGVSM